MSVMSRRSVMPRLPACRFKTTRSRIKSEMYITDPRRIISNTGTSNEKSDFQSMRGYPYENRQALSKDEFVCAEGQRIKTSIA
jgi:hypothetical protein